MRPLAPWNSKPTKQPQDYKGMGRQMWRFAIIVPLIIFVVVVAFKITPCSEGRYMMLPSVWVCY